VDELKQIREVIEMVDIASLSRLGRRVHVASLAALSRLEAREADLTEHLIPPEGPTLLKDLIKLSEAEPDLNTAEIVEHIRDMRITEKQDASGLVSWWNLTPAECGVLISQYANRYCEDICKKRDEWKELATKFRDAVNEMGAV
jgi:hypothetical protein